MELFVPLRLGGPVYLDPSDPEAWFFGAAARGWRTVPCPLDLDAPDDLVREFSAASVRHDITVSEVGAWSSLIGPEAEVMAAAIEKSKKALDLAERLGAGCAVTISGSRSSIWDGPHPDNYSPHVFGLIVDAVREIVDDVRPARAKFCLETMPWALPDSPDSYLELIRAIDRPGFGVHLDPVNMINCPRRALDSAGFLRECFAKLGQHIVNIHAKDFHLSGKLTLHISEVMPGKGQLDYQAFLKEAAALPQEIGFVLEHLETEAEYAEAAGYVRQQAAVAGVALDR